LPFSLISYVYGCSLHMAKNLAGERVYHVFLDILRELVGHNFVSGLRTLKSNKMLSYRRENALQGAL